MSRQQLRSRLDALPRVRIAATPTPLQEAENLSRELGVRILVKRDDLTGLVLGGNKVRHMDFCMADALEKGADVSINVNASTNASSIIGAASKKVGMDYICVAAGSKGGPIQGNLLIQDLFGADLLARESNPRRNYKCDGDYLCWWCSSCWWSLDWRSRLRPVRQAAGPSGRLSPPSLQLTMRQPGKHPARCLPLYTKSRRIPAALARGRSTKTHRPLHMLMCGGLTRSADMKCTSHPTEPPP